MASSLVGEPEPHVSHVRDRGDDPRGLFRIQLGTVDSIVYDAVVEETGSNELDEKWIGRIRAVEAPPSYSAR